MAPFHRAAICAAWLLVCGCSAAGDNSYQTDTASDAQPTSQVEGTDVSMNGVAIQPPPSGAARDTAVNGDSRAIGKSRQDAVIREGARTIHRNELPPLWTHGGSQDDSLIALPMSRAADSERVVVYDSMDGVFTAYSASTGDIQWRVGRRGKGPNEYSAYVVLARTPGGDFLALDWQNLRVTYIEPSTGSTRRAMRWPVLSAPRYPCVTADDRLLILNSSPGRPLIWLTDSVATLEAPLPWPNAREMHQLATQGILAAGPHGDCVLTLKYGQGFARYQQQDSLPLYIRAFVEPVALPILTREKGPGGVTITGFPKGTVRAAITAAVGETEVLIAFGGRSKFRRLLVDRYTLANGDYVGSFLLPFSPAGIAVSAGRIFVIDTSDDYPAVRAFALP